MEHLAGKSRDQVTFRCLSDMVDVNSPARQIDKFVDESDTSYFTKSTPKETGRKPFDPKDLLKLLIYGMDKGVNTTRKLANESRTNIEAMWLMNELTPDSTTIRNFRRENAENLTRFFNEFARTLANAGYIDGKIISIDGTKIRANNSKRNNFSANKLDRHIEYINNKLTEYQNELDMNDRIEDLEERKAKYEGFKDRIASGAVTEVSTTDPDSRLMKQANNGVEVSYNVQAAVDSKNKLIAGFLVVNEANDQGQLHKVASAVKNNLELEEMTVLADKGYYDTADFKACHDDQITTVVAIPEDKNPDKEMFSKQDFTFDKEKDCYYCPAGQILKFSYEGKNSFRYYKNPAACKTCPNKAHCTTSNRREICRHKFAEHAEQNELSFKENYELYKLRQTLSEHPFGTIKRTMGIRQFQTRGIKNVTGEAALIFLAYNLKRLRVIHNLEGKNGGQPSILPAVMLILLIFHFLFDFRR